MQRLYNGQSMKGTFRPGDVLTVEPVLLPQVRPGDVLVFFRQRGQEGNEIVHRVVRRVKGGVVTRGDAVGREDAWIVTQDHLAGRVCYRTRNDRVSRVNGGQIGLWQGRALHFYWGLRRRIVRRFQSTYDRLKASGLVRYFWNPRITRIRIASPDGPCVQYVCNHRVVARYRPETGVFECRKPWDLVIGSFEKS